MTPGVPDFWGYLFLAAMIYLPPIALAVFVLFRLRRRGRVPGFWAALALFGLCQFLGHLLLFALLDGLGEVGSEASAFAVSVAVPSLAAALVRLFRMRRCSLVRS